jgi:hypothetical protein
MEDGMRAIHGYLILAALVPALFGCAEPYYVSGPAPIYYPLRGPVMSSPAQNASIFYAAPRTDASAGRERARSTEARRPRQGVGEQSEATRQDVEHRGGANDGGWINPEPQIRLEATPVFGEEYVLGLPGTDRRSQRRGKEAGHGEGVE